MGRSGRWLWSLIFAVALVLAPMAAFAEEGAAASPSVSRVDPIAALDSARIATDLGVLKGDGDGVTEAYLAKGTTRLQAAILYLRLIGKENEALAYKGTAGFADSANVGSANRPVLAYLKAHPELGWQGTSGGRFEPNAAVTSQQLYKVLLGSLGYASEHDFAYKNTLAFAESKGLRRVAQAGSVTNRELAVALVEALQAKAKGSTETLARKLTAAGALAKDKAAELDGARIDLSRTADGTVYWTDGAGRSLYLFTKDTASLEACQGNCLVNWPVFSADKLIIPDGLNSSDFGVHVRADGTKQVTYQGWPLYYFVKDAKPGDTLGEGVGGVWYLIKQPFYSVTVGTDEKLGNYLTDSRGMTLYYFDKDPSGASVCSGQCLANWPAFHADSIVVPSGLKASDFGEITRDDGTKQTTFKGYPLYYFIKDKARGDVYGQGVQNIWYVVDPAKFTGTTAGRAAK